MPSTAAKLGTSTAALRQMSGNCYIKKNKKKQKKQKKTKNKKKNKKNKKNLKKHIFVFCF